MYNVTNNTEFNLISKSRDKILVRPGERIQLGIIGRPSDLTSCDVPVQTTLFVYSDNSLETISDVESHHRCLGICEIILAEVITKKAEVLYTYIARGYGNISVSPQSGNEFEVTRYKCKCPF